MAETLGDENGDASRRHGDHGGGRECPAWRPEEVQASLTAALALQQSPCPPWLRVSPLQALAKETVLTVSDLKQFTYCPRVVWYTYCLPLLRPETAKMEESRLMHEEERAREARRSLRPYGLPEGDGPAYGRDRASGSAGCQRHYDVSLASATLGLTGRTDLVIVTADEVIPVDYKLTRRATAPHFRLQLAAYGLMLEEASGLPARRGFIYSMWTRQAEEVPFTARLRGQVQRTVDAARHMITQELMPGPAARRGRCLACEFRRFCNDL